MKRFRSENETEDQKIYYDFLESVAREEYIRFQPWWKQLLIRWGWIRI